MLQSELIVDLRVAKFSFRTFDTHGLGVVSSEQIRFLFQIQCHGTKMKVCFIGVYNIKNMERYRISSDQIQSLNHECLRRR